MTRPRCLADRLLVAFGIGALCSVATAGLLKGRPPGGIEPWTRKSYSGRPVTLFEGPGYVVGAVAGALAGGAGAPAAVAGLGAGAFGALDDHVGDTARKGLRGHLAAARRGELTTGVTKIVGLAATGLVTAWQVDRSRSRRAETVGTESAGTEAGALATALGGALIAGSANLVNLLDLRPGRALKVVLLLAVPIAAGGRGAHSSATTTAAATAGAAAGAAVAMLADDLAGRSMLGDTGANSAGALLGTALVARTGQRGRLLALALVTALTLASEKVSFTKVIEATPGLRQLDELGRPSPDSPPGRPGQRPVLTPQA